jgi:MEMO1 family protein
MGGTARLAGALALLLIAAVQTTSASASERVRPSALAGAWYPGDAATLQKTVDGLLDGARTQSLQGDIRALIVPHAGYVYSGETAAAAFAQVRGAQYRRVIVLAPSHHGDFSGLSVAEVDAYATPLGSVPLDQEAIAELRRSGLVQADPGAHSREHAIEIELPFLQRALAPGWQLVPILVGDLAESDYPLAADLLRPLADDHTLVVVSSDFTHFGARFGYLPFPADDQAPERIRALDDGAITEILARDGSGLLDYRARTGITICGYRPLALLLAMLPRDARVERLGYATSGALTGDWSNSVSYAALAVRSPLPISGAPGGPAESQSGNALGDGDLQRLHGIAAIGIRRAVLGQSGVPEGEIIAAGETLPPVLETPAGAFVTLWKKGALRGCVGHVPNDLPLYRAVLESGMNAARNDYRFQPVGPEELDGLEVEVNVLTPPRPIDSIDEFRIGEHGITLRKDGHYALYLPEVAPTMGWDRETTLSQLAIKAGLPADAWRAGAELAVFATSHYRAPYPPGNGSENRELSAKQAQ